MLHLLDKTVDPCKDFHRFSCGGWLKENSKSISGKKWAVFSGMSRSERRDVMVRGILESTMNNYELDSVERKVRLLFQKCMDTGANYEHFLHLVREIIEKHGGWAISGKFIIF